MKLPVTIAACICLSAPLLGCTKVPSVRSGDTLQLSPPLGEAVDAGGPPVDEIAILAETARTFSSDGHLQKAIALYEEAEQRSSSKSEFNRELAPLYAQAGDFEQAIDRYTKAVDESGKDAQLHNNFAWTLMEAGQLQRASEAIEAGLRHAPEHPRLISTAAVIQYKLGDRQAAADLFRSIHGDAAAYHNLAVLDVDRGDEESAKANLARAMQQQNRPRATEEFHRALNGE